MQDDQKVRQRRTRIRGRMDAVTAEGSGVEQTKRQADRCMSDLVRAAEKKEWGKLKVRRRMEVDSCLQRIQREPYGSESLPESQEAP